MIILRFLGKVIKHIIMLPLYCLLPHKYNGITYDEWLKEDEK